TTCAVRRFGPLVVSVFCSRSGSAHSPRYEARSLVLDHFRYRFAQEPSPTGALNTWLTSLPNVSYPPSPITNTQRKYATAPAIALADRTWLLDIGNPALLIADLRDLVSQVYGSTTPRSLKNARTALLLI